MDDIKLAGKKTKHWSDVESTQQRSWFGRTNIFPRSCIPGVYSKTLWNKQRYCGQLQNHVWISIFHGLDWKASILREFSYFFVVLWYGRSCEEMCGTILVSWETRRLNNSTKVSTPCIDDHTSKKKNWNPREICQKYDLKWFGNAYTWHELDDLIFYGQWTNLHDQSHNGPKPGTYDWIVWFHTFITHVNTNNIAMWAILPNNADWNCFKTPILQEILRTQNLLLEEHYVFFESHTFVPKSWMCKKQTAVSHRSTESEIISLDAGFVVGWSSPHLIHGIWSSQFLETRIRFIRERRDPFMNIREVRSTPHTVQKRKQSHGMINDLDNVEFISFKRQLFSSRSFVDCVWRQRSSHQDDF